MTPLSETLRSTIRLSPVSWAHACRIHLRPYQVQIAHAIKDSIIHNLGLTFVIILPRQSGKNELQAHLFAWLMYRYAHAGGRIVSVSPTFKPQTQLCMDRVKTSLNACVGSRGLWKSSKGYSYTLGNAQLQFFSGEPRANVLGATADLLLSVDEAQSISVAKFDKDFDPMTASTNATRLFWGTAWTSDTLLERERRLALQAQQKDGLQRLFYYTADDVLSLVPSYAAHMQRILAAHGRNHPLVRSQYYCETVDAQSGMFTPARLSLINADQIPAEKVAGIKQGIGVHFPSPLVGEGSGVGSISAGQTSALGNALGSPDPSSPVPCSSSPLPCAFLLDIAGMDESRLNPLHSSDFGLGNPGRDSTALTIVQIDLSTLSTLQRPTYHVVARHSWIGENHLTVFGKIKALADTWQPQHIVVDATGVGEGLWAMLDRAFPSRVIPVKFSQQEKSEIGWRFLSIIETGRFRDHVHTDEVRLQYSRCISEILPGPMKTLRWGVPDGARGPDGELIHDDFLLADSLVAKLDALEWYLSFPSIIIQPRDPLEDMDSLFRKPHKDDFDHYYSRPNAL
jgi:Terminase RNaseH-like domain